MKKLNLVGELKIAEQPSTSIKEILRTILKAPTSDRGVSFDEMKDAVSFMNKLDTAGDELLLEKSDHTFLINVLKSFRFNVNDQALYDWIKSIIDLPDIEIQEKKD